MKILQINKFFYVKGGAERYYFDLIKLLESKGHEVIPFSMRDEKNQPTEYEEYFVSNIELGVGALASQEEPKGSIPELGVEALASQEEPKGSIPNKLGVEALASQEEPKGSIPELGVEAFQPEADEPLAQASLKSLKALPQGSISNKLKIACQILYSCEAKRKLEALIKKTKPDIAHLHNIAHQISPSILHTLKKYKIPVVQTLHDYKLICPNYRLFTQGQVCERCKKYKYYHAQIHKCLKNSYLASALGCWEMYVHKFLRIYEKNVDLFIAPSRFMKDKCVEFGQNPEQFVILPYTFNIGDYQPQYDWDRKEKYIVYFGRLAKEKGVDILLEAMREIKGVGLKIIGTGPKEKELRIMNSELGNKNVEFIGHRQGKELYDLVQGAMFAVVPSIWYENSPLAIYEAFALGKPVIGSKIGGIPELVEDNKTGLLFQAGSKKELIDKVRELIDKPERIVKMGRLARQRIEKLADPEEHYKRLIEIYSQVGA